MFVFIRVHENIGTSKGLRGCIKKLKIGRRPMELSKDDLVLKTHEIYECGEDVCEVRPCVNDGRCVFLGPEAYRCVCGPHHVGEFCEKSTEPCHSNPCEFGSTCTALNALTYACECPPGRSGSRCELGGKFFNEFIESIC